MVLLGGPSKCLSVDIARQRVVQSGLMIQDLGVLLLKLSESSVYEVCTIAGKMEEKNMIQK